LHRQHDGQSIINEVTLPRFCAHSYLVDYVVASTNSSPLFSRDSIFTLYRPFRERSRDLTPSFTSCFRYSHPAVSLSNLRAVPFTSGINRRNSRDRRNRVMRYYKIEHSFIS